MDTSHTQTKKFLSLESHLLLELVVKDALVVSDEEHVWEAVLRWAAHNPSAESALAQILTYIRYPLISPVRASSLHARTLARLDTLLTPSRIRTQSYVEEHILPHPYAKLPGVEDAVKLGRNALKLSGYDVVLNHPPCPGVEFTMRRVCVCRSSAVQAGKVMLRQSLADILNRPRTPRSLQGWKELPYSGTPGVLHSSPLLSSLSYNPPLVSCRPHS
jgi:hypothetical protein